MLQFVSKHGCIYTDSSHKTILENQLVLIAPADFLGFLLTGKWILVYSLSKGSECICRKMHYDMETDRNKGDHYGT